MAIKPIVRTPWQSDVEAFVKTANELGHRPWALLSTAHPLFVERKCLQLRKVIFGQLAFYHDELGNRVELVMTGNRTSPIVRQVDPRIPLYCRLQGTAEGWVVRATNKADARRILAAKLDIAPSGYILVSFKPAAGVFYAQ